MPPLNRSTRHTQAPALQTCPSSTSNKTAHESGNISSSGSKERVCVGYFLLSESSKTVPVEFRAALERLQVGDRWADNFMPTLLSLCGTASALMPLGCGRRLPLLLSVCLFRTLLFCSVPIWVQTHCVMCPSTTQSFGPTNHTASLP